MAGKCDREKLYQLHYQNRHFELSYYDGLRRVFISDITATFIVVKFYFAIARDNQQEN